MSDGELRNGAVSSFVGLGSIVARIGRNARNVTFVSASTSFIILSSFARGVVLARILGPHEYGLGILLITVSAGLDFLIDGGVDQYIVRSRFGYRRDILAVAQAYRFCGAAAASILLMVLSHPLAKILAAPELALPLVFVGGATILRSLTNLGVKVQQRDRRYDKEVRIDFARTAAELTAMTICAVLTKSFWCVLVGLYVNSSVQMALSNRLSDTRMSFSLRLSLVRLVGRFSIPIIINAMILFAAVQGDRLVISAYLTPYQVALYAAACAVGQAATSVIARITTSIALPIFAAGASAPERQRKLASEMSSAYIFGSTVLGLGLCVVVPFFVPLLYGRAFAGLGSIVAVSAGVQMIQMEQSFLTALMVGLGYTRSFPIITMCRALSLPFAAIVLSYDKNVLIVPYAVAIGSIFSLQVSYRVLGVGKQITRRAYLISTTRAIVLLVLLSWFVLW